MKLDQQYTHENSIPQLPTATLSCMSVSHFHDPSAASQNVGNHVGNRPCVRQSQLFRRNESGNAMKELMGQTSLQWDTKKLQGAYSGAAYDPNSIRVQQVVQCEPSLPPQKPSLPPSQASPQLMLKFESHRIVAPQRVRRKILKSCNEICRRRGRRRRLLNVHSTLLGHGKIYVESD